MISLRARTFLISWPLVVVAVLAVAAGVNRAANVEFDRLEQRQMAETDRDALARWADSLGRLPGGLGVESATRFLREWSRSAVAPMDLAVLDTTGRVIATTDTTASPEPGTLDAFTPRRWTRQQSLGGRGVARTELTLRGIPIRDANGGRLADLVALPSARAGLEAMGASSTSVASRSTVRRSAVRIAVVTMLIAAVVAVIIATPLVRRIRGLSIAAAEIGRGGTGVRVPAGPADEVGQLARTFNSMAEGLEASKAQQQRLVGDVAHELRTPLTNVVGLIEAMQDGLMPPDGPTLATVHREVGLLASLVHELQELSLAESGQLALEITEVDAVHLVHEAVAAIAPTARHVHVTGDAPQWVRADARRMAQVLRNLLRNALTHTPDGGQITVRVEGRETMVAIIVEDTGTGIPEEHLALVFERFHRVDPSRDRMSGGMGLGLAVVRQLVTAMGGRVWVESRLGEGSRFGVELPRAA